MREGSKEAQEKMAALLVIFFGLFLLSLVQLFCDLCAWYFPGKNTRAGCHFLLQRIFLTQGSNSCLLQCRQILYC